MTTSTLSSPIASGNMVPRTPGWPLVGALPTLVRGPLDYLLQALATLGDIYRLNLGVTEIIALNHPRHA